MIIAFCGHSDFQGTAEYEKKILSFLEEKIGDDAAEFYLGGYGAFDSFAYECCKKYQKTHPNTKLIFITPYINARRHKDCNTLYDEIIYPEIEDKPLRFAISYRNKWIAERADQYLIYRIRRYSGGVDSR